MFYRLVTFSAVAFVASVFNTFTCERISEIERVSVVVRVVVTSVYLRDVVSAAIYWNAWRALTIVDAYLLTIAPQVVPAVI
jgi:hypothetical protein